MRNIKLTIEYNGKNYKGWQRQPDQPTVQQQIEDALYKITKEKININGSGRTDAGVHALGQIATFYTNSNIECEKIKLGLNSIIPLDIAITNSEEVNEEFHARFSAKRKIYKYVIYNNRVRSPILMDYSMHVPYKLDIYKMKEVSKELIGTYDFTSFTSTRSKVQNKVRTIYDIEIDKNEDMIEIRYTGNGFLYNMARILTGTLVDISRGIIKEDIQEIISAKDRKRAGTTAPPYGLYLLKVIY